MKVVQVFELIGGRIGKARRESGEIRRKAGEKAAPAERDPPEAPALDGETEAQTEAEEA